MCRVHRLKKKKICESDDNHNENKRMKIKKKKGIKIIEEDWSGEGK